MGGTDKGQRSEEGGKNAAPPRQVHRDALQAWAAFREIGGLDLSDRDADLEPEILVRLGQPQAGTLAEALQYCSTDDLVRALFGAISPFVAMFRDTLDFFKAAGAKEGRQQWDIKVDDAHLDLKDFEKFFKAMAEVEGRLEVPDFDAAIAFELISPFSSMAGFEGLYAPDPDGEPEEKQWLEDYGRGGFPSLPAGLRSTKLSPGLDDLRRVLEARLAILRDAYGDRATLDAKRDWSYVVPDAYHPKTVGQQDHDLWARSAFNVLSRAARASAEDRAEADAKLQAQFSGPRRMLDHVASADQLERILSLPVWGKRHELYAVWIATVIVGALPDHDVELHHDQGRIIFAFKETEIARILTSRPERRLISERRTELANPLGEKRTGAAQPDFGIWVSENGTERCLLVVEVKHYKKEKVRDFRHVLTDYARAHPEAKVVLVNHGPLSQKIYTELDQALRLRCGLIGTLTSQASAEKAKLRELVRKAVGEPVRRRPARGPASFLIDVSGSMDRYLTRETLQAAAVHAAAAGAVTAVLVDTGIVDRLGIEAVPSLNLNAYASRGTELGPTATELLGSTPLLIALTDAEGHDQLRQAGLEVEIAAMLGDAILVEAW